jgi:hypothetical protein
MNKKKIFFIITTFLFLFCFVAYVIYDSFKTTTYGEVMNEILEGEPIKSIKIQSYETPRLANVIINERNKIETITEKPSEMKIKETNNNPSDYLYVLWIEANNNTTVLLYLTENGIRLNGTKGHGNQYIIEVDNSLLKIVNKIFQQEQ